MKTRGNLPWALLTFLAASTIVVVHCLPAEEVGAMKLGQMERIKANIVAQLGLTEPLLPAEPLTQDEEKVVAAFKDYHAAKEARRTLAKRSITEKPTTKHVSTFIGELHKQGIVDSYYTHFDLDPMEENMTIAQADLLLFQDSPVPGQSDSHLHIEIKASTDGPSLAVSIKHAEIGEPGYNTFDITPVLKLWLTNNKGPLVLEVSAYCVDAFRCNKSIFDGGLGDKSPKLIISRELEDDSSQQQRRLKRQSTGLGAGFCVPEDSIICCLHPLTINFKNDLGMDSILQPPEFPANYCQGICPEVSDILMTPGRFGFYSRLDSSNPASSVEPCCVTHTTQSLEVLMKVNGILVIEELQDVIANACRCG